MKLNKLFALGLACLAFTACSNDKEELDGGNTPTTTKSIVVNIGFPKSKQLRSLDNQSQVGKYAPVNTLQLIIADATGKIYVNETINKSDLTDLAAKTGTANEDIYAKTYTDLPLAATVVYAVANLPAKDKSDEVVNLSGYTNLNTLKGNVSLITFENQNSDINAANVVLQGEKKAIPDANDPRNYSANVELVPVVSRIELSSVTLSTDPQNAIEGFTVEAVYLNSYFGGSTLSPSLVGDTIYNANKNGTTKQTTLDILPGLSFFKTVVGGLLPNVDNKIVAYNFFPSKMPHLLIKLSGITYTATSGLTGMPTEGWITVQKYNKDGNPFDVSTTAGEVYTIDGLTFDHTHIGPNPYSKSINVIATIQVKPWTEVKLQPSL